MCKRNISHALNTAGAWPILEDSWPRPYDDITLPGPGGAPTVDAGHSPLGRGSRGNRDRPATRREDQSEQSKQKWQAALPACTAASLS